MEDRNNQRRLRWLPCPDCSPHGILPQKKKVTACRMLKIFCAAIALFDILFNILQQDKQYFKSILDGIKLTLDFLTLNYYPYIGFF